MTSRRWESGVDVTQDPTDLAWELKATFTSVDGAHNNQVHQKYFKALFEADWAEAKPFNVDDYTCETIDGDPLDPTEAFANSMINKIRRVIVNAKDVVIDMGTARFFTGLTRDAVRIKDRECFWPGCHVPATSCEAKWCTRRCERSEQLG